MQKRRLKMSASIGIFNSSQQRQSCIGIPASRWYRWSLIIIIAKQ
jgi:hypothetical protein